jgi:pimeloyl-ACP methyl ester carboxylesterase
MPKLVSKFAYSLWFKTQRHPRPSRENLAFESAYHQFIDMDGRHIATYTWGENGPWVLLIHGWSGRGTQMAPFIDPLLEAGYRILSFDAPGHGKSDGKGTSAVEIVKAIITLDKHYGPFHALITHSFGGLCAAAALHNNITVQRAIFIAAPASLLNLLERFAAILRLTKTIQTHIRQRAEQQFGTNIWERMDTCKNVRNLSSFGLVIHDEEDRDVPWQEGRAIAQAWPSARFVKTQRLGHHRILRDASTISEVVGFISANNTDISQYEKNEPKLL